MFEAPAGSAARRSLLDVSYAVGLLAAAILSGYGLLAPERLGLATASEAPARPVVVATTRVPEEAPAPHLTSATPSPAPTTTEPARTTAPRPSGP